LTLAASDTSDSEQEKTTRYRQTPHKYNKIDIIYENCINKIGAFAGFVLATNSVSNEHIKYFDFYFNSDRAYFCVELTYFARESAKIEIWKGGQIIKPVFVLPVGTSWQTKRLSINFGIGSYILRISTYAITDNFFIGELKFCSQSGIFF